MSEKENKEQGFGQTIKDDLKRGDFFSSLSMDWFELKDFFLTEDRKTRLEQMSFFVRFFMIPYWLFKSLFLKLNPGRRILLIIGILMVLMMNSVQVKSDSQAQISFQSIIPGVIVILFVLMLELKDKLLAKNQLEAGRTVQNAMMPEKNPVIPGWDIWLYTRPANDVGGDMIDYIKLEDNKHGLSIGDVSGKGLGAALFMVKLQSTLRAIISDYRSLEKFAGKLNKIFYRDTDRRNFASMLYMETSDNSGEIRLVNAGHMPPIIIDDKSVVEIPKTSPAIGLMPGAKFKEQKITVESGAILLLYSDGLTEAKDEFGNFYGEERMKKFLPKISHLDATQFGERLLDKIFSFIQSAPANDDMSLIVLKKQ
jgi:phosphoserine phosphatase RsbU/P